VCLKPRFAVVAVLDRLEDPLAAPFVVLQALLGLAVPLRVGALWAPVGEPMASKVCVVDPETSRRRWNRHFDWFFAMCSWVLESDLWRAPLTLRPGSRLDGGEGLC
jgi:hypothetical protein